MLLLCKLFELLFFSYLCLHSRDLLRLKYYHYYYSDKLYLTTNFYFIQRRQICCLKEAIKHCGSLGTFLQLLRD